MGAYLSAPVTTKDSSDGTNAWLRFGCSSMQGWRKSMEDAHIVGDDIAGATLFGVFDGHGGAEVARYVARHMTEEVPRDWADRPEPAFKGLFRRMDELIEDPHSADELAALKNGAAPRADGSGSAGGAGEDKIDYKQALSLFQKMVAESSPGGGGGGGAAAASSPAPAAGQPSGLTPTQQRPSIAGLGGRGRCALDDHRVAAGCTSVVVAARRVGDRAAELWCANAGDSRAVCCRAGVAVPLSFDHKPNGAEESRRIEAAGGYVECANGFYRVNGNLNLSRSLGDLKYKQDAGLPWKDQVISGEPDVLKHQLSAKDEFFIVACDGVWDVLSNQEAVTFVRDRVRADRARGVEPDLSKICEAIFDRCIATDPKQTRGVGGDNMTCAIVEVKPDIAAKFGS